MSQSSSPQPPSSASADPSEAMAAMSIASSESASRAPTGGPQHRPAPPPPSGASSSSSSSSSASPGPSTASLRPGGPGMRTGSGGPPPRAGGGGGPPSRPAGGGSGGGGPMNAQERARQMASARLPPSLQAKLAANAARSSAAAPGSGGGLGGPTQGSGGPGASQQQQQQQQPQQNSQHSPSFMSSQQRLDPSSLLARGGPSGSANFSGGSAFPPPSAPGMGGLAARRMGGGGGPAMNLSNMGASGGGGGPMAAAGPPGGGAGGMGGRRNKPALKLSDIGASASPSASGSQPSSGEGQPGSRSLNTGKAGPPGRLLNAPTGGLMSSAFSEFSDVIDPSGRLNFAGKAVLHASGVEFGNGVSFKINMENLELQDVLGKGNYGEVRKVRHTTTGVQMAMKEIRLELDASKLNAIIMELDILHRAVSPNIVEFYGAFFIESCVFYCIEFMDAGSLENLLNGRCSVPEDVLARITRSMVKGLAFLKDELQIMHRDVKPTNVLVNTKGQIKLCDFGVSGQLEKSLAKTNIGCQSYMAPERIKGESMSMPSTYTVASDVWSLGLTIVETTLGVYPYPPETYSNVFAQLQAIVHGDPPQLPPESYSEVGRDFVARCLEKMPQRRSTYAQMLQHPWLLADEERGEEGVDMKGWVQGAMAKKKEAKEQQRSEAAAAAATTNGSATGPNGSSS